MVVLLHVSHFCCPLFYNYSPQTHELSGQSGFDDNGEGIEGPLFTKKSEQEKLPGELRQGEEGEGSGDIPSPFLLNPTEQTCNTVGFRQFIVEL